MRTLFQADFVLADPPIELGEDDIHLWMFPQRDIAGSTRLDTQQRLRELLAAYLAADPDTLRIERGAQGKPYLADHPLHFNLSHSGRMLLIGVSRAQPLGVDVESSERARPYGDIARRYFTADEAAALSRLSDDQLRRSFLDLWSAKEAVLKAIGRGIAFGLDRVGFALDADGAVAELTDVAVEAGPLAQWHIVRLAPDSGVTGALAWHGPARQIRAFTAADRHKSATVHPPLAS